MTDKEQYNGPFASTVNFLKALSDASKDPGSGAGDFIFFLPFCILFDIVCLPWKLWALWRKK